MRWVLAAAALSVVFVPAAHSQAMEVRVVPIQNAPLAITAAQIAWQAPPDWAARYKAPPTYNTPLVPLYLQVKNASGNTISAYRLLVITYDAFGDYLDTCRATAVGAITTQNADMARWSLTMRMAYLAWTVVVYLDAVRFDSGQVWRVDPESVATMIPTTAPGVRFQSWHILPDPREVLPQHAKDPVPAG